MFSGNRFLKLSFRLYFLSFIACQLVPVTLMGFFDEFDAKIVSLYAIGLALQLAGFGLIALPAAFFRYLIRGGKYSEIGFDNSENLRIGVISIALMTAAIFISLSYFVSVDNALIKIALGGTDTVAARLESHVDQFGRVYGYSQRFLMPLLFMIGALMLRRNECFLKRLTGAFLVLLALVYNSWGSDKTPVAMLFVMLFFLSLMMAPELRLRSIARKAFLPLLVALASVLLIFSFKPAWDSGLYYILSFVVQRVTWNPAVNTYHAFSEFYQNAPKTLFLDLAPVRYFSGGGDGSLPLSKIIAELRGDFISKAPPTTVGHFYAQFGLAGCFLSGVLNALLIYVTAGLLAYSGVLPIISYSSSALFLFAVTRLHWASVWNVASAEILPIWLICLLAFGGRLLRGAALNRMSQRNITSHA